jgi:hypothetical protein
MKDPSSSASMQPLFSMSASAPEPDPVHRAIGSCLLDMRRYLGSFTAEETLQRLFDKFGGVGNSDPYPWELCRWKHRYVAEDANEQPLRDQDFPDIKPDDFLAWCDPFDFGPDNHWKTYSEHDFKLILEDAFGVWVKESPQRRQEFEAALASHGMRLPV